MNDKKNPDIGKYVIAFMGGFTYKGKLIAEDTHSYKIFDEKEKIYIKLPKLQTVLKFAKEKTKGGINGS